MLLGRCAPGGAGVVDQHIDRAQALQRLGAKPLQIGLLGAVGHDPLRLDPLRLEPLRRFVEFIALARHQQHARTGLA